MGMYSILNDMERRCHDAIVMDNSDQRDFHL